MTSEIEQLYQDIGTQAVAAANGPVKKLLLYAEVQPGVVSADIFYTMGTSPAVKFLFASDALLATVYRFWTQWKQQTGNREWVVMLYVLENGRVNMELNYANQLDANEDIAERRSHAIKKHFGDSKVDYSAGSQSR